MGLLFQSIVFGSGITIQHWELSFRFLHGGTMLFFLIGQVAVRLNHQVDVFLDLCPAQRNLLMIRVVVKFKSFSIMIYKTAAAIQKILRMSADAVLFCQML